MTKDRQSFGVVRACSMREAFVVRTVSNALELGLEGLVGVS